MSEPLIVSAASGDAVPGAVASLVAAAAGLVAGRTDGAAAVGGEAHSESRGTN